MYENFKSQDRYVLLEVVTATVETVVGGGAAVVGAGVVISVPLIIQVKRYGVCQIDKTTSHNRKCKLMITYTQTQNGILSR
jgi:hypothetical protein